MCVKTLGMPLWIPPLIRTAQRLEDPARDQKAFLPFLQQLLSTICHLRVQSRASLTSQTSSADRSSKTTRASEPGKPPHPVMVGIPRDEGARDGAGWTVTTLDHFDQWTRGSWPGYETRGIRGAFNKGMVRSRATSQPAVFCWPGKECVADLEDAEHPLRQSKLTNTASGWSCKVGGLERTQHGESSNTLPPTSIQEKRAETKRKGSGLLWYFTRMYGKAPWDEGLAELWSGDAQDLDTYPVGWKRVLLLLCAFVPYTIVSPAKYICGQDLGSQVSYFQASLDDTIIGTQPPGDIYIGVWNMLTLASHSATGFGSKISKACRYWVVCFSRVSALRHTHAHPGQVLFTLEDQMAFLGFTFYLHW